MLAFVMLYVKRNSLQAALTRHVPALRNYITSRTNCSASKQPETVYTKCATLICGV